MTAYQTTSDPTAVAGRRFGAYVIDALIWALAPLLIFGLTSTVWEGASGFGVTCEQLELIDAYDTGSEVCLDGVTINDEDAAVTMPIAMLVLGSALPLLYGIVVMWIIQGLTGMTLGKLIFGVRTVNDQGTGPGIGKQFIRGLIWVFEGSICSGLIPAILVLTTKGHRRLGDMAAGTYVVKSADRGRPVILPGDGGAASTAPPPYATVPPGPASSGPGFPTAPPPAPTPAPAPAQDVATPPPPSTMTAPPPPSSPGPSDETTVDQAPSTDAETPSSETPSASERATREPSPPSQTPVSNQTMQFNVPPSAPGDEMPPADPDAGPQWDANRNAYIQYDASRGWLIFDDAAQEWKPLS